jgi:hypothetical protein
MIKPKSIPSEGFQTIFKACVIYYFFCENTILDLIILIGR